MNAALAVHRPVCDLEESLAAMEARVAEAAAAGARLVVFPEAATTGLVNNDDPAHDLPLGQAVPGPATDRLGAAARRHALWLASGLLEREGDALYDSAVLLGPDGGIQPHYRRIQPQWHGRSADPRVYRQGDRVEAAETPFGRVAFLLCGDLFDDGIVARLRDARPGLLLVPFSRSFADGRVDQARWDRDEEPAYAARAALAGCLTLMVNALEDLVVSEGPAFGGAMAVSARGDVLARFPLGRPGILHVALPHGQG